MGNIFTNQETQVPMIICVVTWTTAMAVLAVVGRFWVRLKYLGRSSLWIDDYLILFAGLIQVFGMALMNYLLIKEGSGRHFADLPQPIDLRKALFEIYMGEFFYFLEIAVIKMSILFFVFRFGGQTILRYPTLALMGFVMLSSSIIILINIFQCMPVSFAWDQTGGPSSGKCIDTAKFWTAAAGINIVSDILIYILPLKTLWDVQLPKKQRIGLIVVFSLGLFVVLMSFLRLDSLIKAGRSQDPFWDNTPSALWSTSELSVAIICACLPSMKPLFTRVFGGKSQIGSSNPSDYSYGRKSGRSGHSASGRGNFGTLGTTGTHGGYDLEGIVTEARTSTTGSRDNVLTHTNGYDATITRADVDAIDKADDPSQIRKTTNITVSRVPSQ